MLKSSGRLLIPETFYRTVAQKLDKYGRQIVGKSLDCLNSDTTGEISFMADAVQLLDDILHDLNEIAGNLEEVNDNFAILLKSI